MEVRDAPGWPGFSGEGAGSFAGKLKARVENCEIKKIPASDQNSPSRPARREVLRSKFITRSISSPLKCLGSITAFPAGQSAAKQPRCAAERRDWDRGAATPEALSPHARTRRLPRAQGLALPPRSEEHTSELQSRLHLVCRLLLEKKKIHNIRHVHYNISASTVDVLSPEIMTERSRDHV